MMCIFIVERIAWLIVLEVDPQYLDLLLPKLVVTHQVHPMLLPIHPNKYESIVPNPYNVLDHATIAKKRHEYIAYV
jgi:hypothetical protein